MIANEENHCRGYPHIIFHISNANLIYLKIHPDRPSSIMHCVLKLILCYFQVGSDNTRYISWKDTATKPAPPQIKAVAMSTANGVEGSWEFRPAKGESRVTCFACNLLNPIIHYCILI